MRDLLDAVRAYAPRRGLAMAQHRHARRGGRDALSEDGRADEGVDKGRLAGIELTGDDEQEGLLQGLGRAAQGLGVLGGGLEAVQAGAKLFGEAALFGEDLNLALAQDGGGEGHS